MIVDGHDSALDHCPRTIRMSRRTDKDYQHEEAELAKDV